MNEKEFEAGHADVLRALRSARGDCPEAVQLLDWAEGGLGGEAAEAVERHVALCSQCAGIVEAAKATEPEVDDVGWRRAARGLDARQAPWRPAPQGMRPAWLGLAAAAVAALAVVVVFLPRGQQGPAEAIATTRSADIVLVEPRGAVGSVESFRWQGIPAPVRYRVEVRAGGSAEPLWSGVTEDTRLRADEALRAALGTSRPLQWRVVVIDAEGHELGRSDWAAFQVE